MSFQLLEDVVVFYCFEGTYLVLRDNEFQMSACTCIVCPRGTFRSKVWVSTLFDVFGFSSFFNPQSSTLSRLLRVDAVNLFSSFGFRSPIP